MHGWPDAVSSALARYADVDGRTRRRDFWLFGAFHFALTFCTWSVAYTLAAVALVAWLVEADWTAEAAVVATWWTLVASTLSLVLLVPFYTAAARRLHDTGRSAVWLVLVLVPYGGLYLYYPWLLDSAPGPNEHGPNPKGVVAPLGWPAPTWSPRPR